MNCKLFLEQVTYGKPDPGWSGMLTEPGIECIRHMTTPLTVLSDRFCYVTRMSQHQISNQSILILNENLLRVLWTDPYHAVLNRGKGQEDQE